MLRSVFTVRHDRLAVALEGGHVIEVGDPNRCAVIIGGATVCAKHDGDGASRCPLQAMNMIAI